MMAVCVLLAAGSSSRMGQPKMLLDFKGKTLLQHIIDEVKMVNDVSLLVITGCYHELLKEILQEQQIPFIQNESWEEGMGTSVQKGMKEVLNNYTDTNNTIFLVCDQPYISAGLLQEMIHTKQITGKGIVACGYDDTTGTPVLFDKRYFTSLAILQGKYGAKKIVQQFAEDTAIVNFPLGVVDIDTPDDYSQLTGII